MLEFFRRNLFINSLLLLPITILLRIQSIYKAIPYMVSDSDSFIAKTIFNTISDGRVQSVIACFFIFFQALLINRFIIKNNLSKEITLITGLIFVTISSLFFEYGGLTPALLANTFIILSLNESFRTYNNANVSAEIFLSGFFMAVAAIIYPPCIIFFLLSNLALLIMRSYIFIERIQHFIGWVCAYFLLLTWQYFIGYHTLSIPYDYIYQFGMFNYIKWTTLSAIIMSSILIALSTYFVLQINYFFQKSANSIQKRISILYWLMMFTGLIVLIYKNTRVNHILLYCLPASYFMAMLLLKMKNKMMQELIYIIMIIIAVIANLGFIRL